METYCNSAQFIQGRDAKKDFGVVVFVLRYSDNDH